MIKIDSMYFPCKVSSNTRGTFVAFRSSNNYSNVSDVKINGELEKVSFYYKKGDIVVLKIAQSSNGKRVDSDSIN